jgi:hypothetical protein
VYFKNTGQWTSYADYIKDRMGYVAQLNVGQVIVVGQMPTWKTDLPKVLTRQFILRGLEIPERSGLELEELSIAMDATLRKISLPKGFRYLSLTDILCNANGCLTRVGPDLTTDLLVWDYGHLTTVGAKFVVEKTVGPAIRSALGS